MPIALSECPRRQPFFLLLFIFFVCLLQSSCNALSSFSEPWDPIPGGIITRPLYGPLSFYGNGSSYPSKLINSLGSAFGSRPGLGDDSTLRKAVTEARDFKATGKVLTILVIGGSPAYGASCKNSLQWIGDGDQAKASGTPGVFEEGVFAFTAEKHQTAVDPKSERLCSWSARLARYIAVQLLPEHRNFIIMNGAQGGVGSMYFLLKAHHDWEETSIGELFQAGNLPAGAKEKLPTTASIAETVDLVLMDFTANDQQKESSEFMSSTEGLFRFFETAKNRSDGGPTVALVDQACQNWYRVGEGVAHFHAMRRDLAKKHSVAVIDTTIGGSGFIAGAADDASKLDQEKEFVDSIDMESSLRLLLQNPGKGSKGFGHFNAAYHEWAAATVYYSLFGTLDRKPLDSLGATVPNAMNPATSDCSSASTGKAAMMCHLSRGTVTSYNFMQSKVARNLTFDDEAWVYGEDVPGKAGWITCDTREDFDQLGHHRFGVNVVCEAGDLIVGYLESYDKRMGVARVSVLPAVEGNATKAHTLTIDARRPDAHESVFRIAVLQGLTVTDVPRSEWRVFIEPVPRDGQEQGQNRRWRNTMLEESSGVSEISGKCTHNKFKLLMLACT